MEIEAIRHGCSKLTIETVEVEVEEDEDVFVEEPQDDLRCPICIQVLTDPVQTRCGHRFCRQCIEQLLTSGNALCPIDREPLPQENIFPDNAVKLQINRLRVRCPHHKKGCTWVGDRSDKYAHMQTCSHSYGKCQQCGEAMALRLIKEHREVCPRRSVQCGFCGTTMPHCDLLDHKDVCPKMPVPCPNNCQRRAIPQEELEVHLSVTCPRQLVSCSLAALGCQERVERGQLSAHLQKCSIQRVGTLAQLVLEQREEIRQLKEEIEQNNRAMMELNDSCYPAYGQFTWRIRDIRDKIIVTRDDPASGVVYSPPFYTGEGGYKLCLCVYPAGDSNQNCLSLYFVVMRGPYDEILPWPFQKRVLLTLFNCVGGPHYQKEIIPDPRLHYFSRPRTDKNVGYGYPKFMPLPKLLSEDSEYVQGSSIFIRAQVLL